MCDPKSAKMKLGIPETTRGAYGSMLQMSRMLPQKRSPFEDLSSSDSEEFEEEDVQSKTESTLHTFQSLLKLKEEIDKATPKEAKKPRIPEREIPTMPTGSFGIDPSVLKMIYNMGYDAGLDKRDPIPPCEVCEERRRKNRIAAAEQRRRQREEQEDDDLSHKGK